MAIETERDGQPQREPQNAPLSEKGSRRPISLRKRLLFAGVILFVFLLATDRVLGLLPVREGPPQRPILDRKRLSFLPNLQGALAIGTRFDTNHTGFRDTDRFTAAVPGKIRVLVAGDSFTFGALMPQGETFPDRLEETLNRDLPARYVVYNLGIPGTNSDDQLALLRRHLPRYPSAVVVLQWFGNDLLEPPKLATSEMRTGAGEPQPAPEPPTSAGLWQAAKSVLKQNLFPNLYQRAYPPVRELLYKSSLKSARHAATDPSVRGRWGALYTESQLPGLDGAWEKNLATIARIQALVRANRARLILLVVPYASQVAERYREHLVRSMIQVERAVARSDEPQRRLQAFARTAGIFLVDPLDRLRQVESAGNTAFIPGDHHFSRLGNQIVAGMLAEAIRAVLADK